MSATRPGAVLATAALLGIVVAPSRALAPPSARACRPSASRRGRSSSAGPVPLASSATGSSRAIRSASSCRIETTIQNVAFPPERLDWKGAQQLLGAPLPSPLGDIALFGAGNTVFAPHEAGYDLRFRLEQLYQSGAFELPAFPGLVVDFVATSGDDVSDGIVGAPPDDPSHNYALGTGQFPDARPYSLHVPFVASAFTGSSSRRRRRWSQTRHRRARRPGDPALSRGARLHQRGARAPARAAGHLRGRGEPRARALPVARPREPGAAHHGRDRPDRRYERLHQRRLPPAQHPEPRQLLAAEQPRAGLCGRGHRIRRLERSQLRDRLRTGHRPAGFAALLELRRRARAHHHP
jgi:hypothetical protein